MATKLHTDLPQPASHQPPNPPAEGTLTYPSRTSIQRRQIDTVCVGGSSVPSPISIHQYSARLGPTHVTPARARKGKGAARRGPKRGPPGKGREKKRFLCQGAEYHRRLEHIGNEQAGRETKRGGGGSLALSCLPGCLPDPCETRGVLRQARTADTQQRQEVGGVWWMARMRRGCIPAF